MDHNRLDAEEHPADPSPNPTPHPAVDVTQTKPWASISNDFPVDIGTAVTHSNLESLAGLIQATSRMIIEQAKDIKKLQAENRIIKADLRSVLRALGEETASEASRRSSMNSRRASLGSRTSSVGGATGDDEEITEDPAEAALAKFIDGLESIDDYFESFISTSGKHPLMKHTKNIQAFSVAFKEAANTQLAGFVGEERANEMLGYLSLFEETQLEEAYMAMSRRYTTNKKKGKRKAKKATTLNEGFATDVSGRGGDGSQSTDINSPMKTRTARAPKTPHRPRARRAITIEPEDIEDE
ncbi:hypothetical protein CEP51_016255 [Fusarium floridanum]|uniref:Uncharacterized protein n=1 Tax=Fusarium floridanum TaxID=1325733 RepID=A0A428NU05_9HYPO|nr:hypothetical protein CEP51_016255 [Fusarium floridanum]